MKKYIILALFMWGPINQYIYSAAAIEDIYMDEPIQNQLAQNLIDAIKNKQVDNVETLMAQGASTDYIDKYGLTPLYYALFYDDLNDPQVRSILKIILNFKVNFDQVINHYHKSTLLMHAASLKSSPLQLQFLLDAGAQVNLKDKDGDTALIYAITINNKDAIRLLILAGANPNLIDNEGKTAWTALPIIVRMKEQTIETMEKALAEKQQRDQMLAGHLPEKNVRNIVREYIGSQP